MTLKNFLNANPRLRPHAATRKISQLENLVSQLQAVDASRYDGHGQFKSGPKSQPRPQSSDESSSQYLRMRITLQEEQ